MEADVGGPVGERKKNSTYFGIFILQMPYIQVRKGQMIGLVLKPGLNKQIKLKRCDQIYN